MPFYEFKCNNPKSPYYDKPKTLFLSVKEYMATRDKLTCEITKSPLMSIVGSPGFRTKGSNGFHSTGRV
jgi:hypothetical protein